MRMTRLISFGFSILDLGLRRVAHVTATPIQNPKSRIQNRFGALRLPLLVALPLMLGACSGFTVPDLDEEVKAEKIIPADWKPVKLSVGLAPVVAELELDAKKLNVEDTLRWVLTPDEARLNLAEQSVFNQIRQTLLRYKMFERVEAIKGVNSKTKPPALRQAAQGFLSANTSYVNAKNAVTQ